MQYILWSIYAVLFAVVFAAAAGAADEFPADGFNADNVVLRKATLNALNACIMDWMRFIRGDGDGSANMVYI